MKLNTVKLNIFVLSFFVIHVWAMPGVTREAVAAEAEAGAAHAGAEAGAATAAGVTTGTIAAGIAIAAAVALVIATSGGEARAMATPVPPILPIIPSPSQFIELFQTLESNDVALLATATTAWGTTGQNAVALAANALSLAEFQNLATLTANLDQATVSGLAAASIPLVLGSSQGGITTTEAFSTSLTNTDFTAVIAALNTDIGTVPLAARDSLTLGQKKMYDYLAALRASAVGNPSLKAGFNGLYQAANQAKSSATAAYVLTNLINGVGSFDTTNKLDRINILLTQITSNTGTFNATQNLFKTTDNAEVTAIQNIFNASLVKGSLDSSRLRAIADIITEGGTGTPAEIAGKQSWLLLTLITSQHPGYTVVVTVSHLGNNIYTTVAHIKK